MMEVLVVIALIMLVSLILMPNILHMIRKAQVEGVINQVTGVFEATRMQAIKTNSTATLDIDETNKELVGARTIQYNNANMSAWTEADCWDGYAMPPFVYDAQGKVDDKRALCMVDRRGNIFQFATDSIQGTPRIRKWLRAEDSPTGTAGFFLKGNGWIWY